MCGINYLKYIYVIYLFELGSGGIRTHASEATGALNQFLRPLDHATRYGSPCNSNLFAFH